MRVVLRGVVLLVTLAALVAVVWGQLWLRGGRADETRDRTVATAAATAAGHVLSYDYRSLEDGFDSTLPLLTGDAKQQYGDLRDPLLTTAPGLQAVVEAEVKETTVLESDDDSARVLLFVDQTSTSTKLTEPQTDQSRIVVTLVRKSGDWLVDTLASA